MKKVKNKIKQKIQKFYDVGSPYFFKFWGIHIHDGYYITGKESQHEAQENLVRFLAEKAHIKRRAKILDVGCGIGGSSIYLSKNFDAPVTGVTISHVQVEMAKKFARENNANCRFLVMDAEEMNFTKKFDAIWMVGVLTLLTDQERFLKQSSKFLNKKGKFILLDWMIANDIRAEETKKYIQPIQRGMLITSFYSMNIYLQWLIKYGYRIVYAEDITAHTIKTWNVMLSIIKNPSLWKLAYKEGIEFVNFFKCIRIMKRSMKDNKIRCCAIIAEKL